MKQDPDILPVRPGRTPREARTPTELTPAEENELAAAKQGKREWVGPGVTAYMLGITKETLKKRRQRRDGLVPEHREATSNRGGTKYRWSSVARCAGAERLQNDVLAQRLEDVVALLVKKGIAVLGADLPWAFDARGRLVGLAVFHPGLLAAPLSVLEALEEPWVSELIRAPYHAMAIEVLEKSKAIVLTSREKWLDYPT